MAKRKSSKNKSENRIRAKKNVKVKPADRLEIDNEGIAHFYKNFDKRKIALALIIVSYLLYTIWAFASPGTWDADCASRAMNARNAFNDPVNFIGLWNRPLWIMIFAIPTQISYATIPIIMSGISVLGAYFLYRAACIRGYVFPSLVIFFYLFQPYFMGTGRDAMTEPVAATIIAASYYMYVQKKWLPFVLLGALLPLARTEMAVHLIFWLIPLVRHKLWKFIPLLGLGLAFWTVLAGVLTGDWVYLYTQTLGSELSENRYGSQEITTYTSRFFYVVGPVVFLFALLGYVRSVVDRKASLFIEIQMLFGLGLYTLFASKIVIGQSAGFLRNLIPLSPLIAMVAMAGFDFWFKRSFGKGKWPVMIGVVLGAILVFVYYRFNLKLHHLMSENVGVLHLSYFSVSCLILLMPWSIMISKWQNIKSKIGVATASIIGLLTMSFTLISEPPSINMNSERQMITRAVDIIKSSDMLSATDKKYSSHSWYYWMMGTSMHDDDTGLLNKAVLEKADPNTFVLWENHFSNRISSDVPVNYLLKSKDYIHLATIYADDYTKNGFFFYRKDSAESELQVLNRFVASTRDYPEGYLRIADYYKNKQDFENAKVFIDKALSVDSTYTYAKLAKSQIFNAQNKPDQALKLLADVKDVFKESVSYYQEEGTAYFKKNDFEKSKASFLMGIEKKEDSGLLHFNVGVCNFRLDKSEEACKYFKRAKEFKFSNAEEMMKRTCKY